MAVWIIGLAALVVVIGYGIVQLRGSDKETAGQSLAAQQQAAGYRTVASAKGGFSVTFPPGWQKILRIMDSDRFVITGKDQPIVRQGMPAQVEDVLSYTSDNPLVFNAEIGSDFASPQGSAIDLLIGQGNQLLSGKKHVYQYELNGRMANGQERSKGDLDYIYVFALGGSRELRIEYRVYAADRQDKVADIDRMVKSIRRL